MATLDLTAISAAFEARAIAACPAHGPLAKRLIGDLQPPRWTLEWYLPWWLGQSLALDPETAREVVLGNVLGLASLRLRDDDMDGEIAPVDQAGARALSAALYAEAVAVYQALMPPASPFWRAFSRSMSQWEAATRAHAPNASFDLVPGPRARRFRVIAQRGAPLKVCATALCLLADRADIVPSLDAALDHALAAWVLYDDARDWEVDLAAGRWNAFVARLANASQEPSRRQDNHHSVVLAMLTGNTARRYYADIEREAERAAEICDQVGLSPLSAHLRRFAEVSGRQGERLQNHYHAVTERATVLLFGDGSE